MQNDTAPLQYLRGQSDLRYQFVISLLIIN